MGEYELPRLRAALWGVMVHMYYPPGRLCANL
jgi:hypothetical protein